MYRPRISNYKIVLVYKMTLTELECSWRPTESNLGSPFVPLSLCTKHTVHVVQAVLTIGLWYCDPTSTEHDEIQWVLLY